MKKTAGFLKFLLVVILFTILPAAAFADTYVSGPITSDTTWTLANSPYIATGGVLVMSGVTLTIEPGVTVKFNSGLALQIDGTLIARGTNNSNITFTSNQAAPAAGDWGYILFSNSSTDATYDIDGNYTGGSILEYAIVEYAGGVSVSNNGAVRMDNAHPFINYCTIRNNKASGIYAWNLSGKLKIMNGAISDNTSSGSGGGIYAYNSTVTISNNIVSNNTASYGGGIFTERGTVTISNNIVSNNTASYGGGIYVTSYNATVATISNNIISDNIASKFGGGIYYMMAIKIINNTINRNFAKNASAIWDLTWLGGYKSSGSNNDINHNTITENKATDTVAPHTLFIEQNAQPLFNYNNIFGNIADYELYNNNTHLSANVNAENNWWGSALESDIQAKIYDWIDDASKGFVDYIPWEASIRTDAPISPPTGLTATLGTGTISLSWSANPESDVAGYKVYWDTDSNYPYANVIDVGNVTNYTLAVSPAAKYHVTITAYDSNYNSSNDDPNTIVNDNQTNGNESWYAQEKIVMIGGCIDNDGDGYGNPGDASCLNGSATDCNDNATAINPGATEVCNGVDDNCNGLIDEGFSLNTYYQDFDGDAYGNPLASQQACTQPVGYVSNNTDCNDGDAAINPAATEVCDGVDNNCDSTVDEGCVPHYMCDINEDGFCDISDVILVLRMALKIDPLKQCPCP